MDGDEGDSQMLPIGDDQRTATGARRRYRAGNTYQISCTVAMAGSQPTTVVSMLVKGLLHSISYVIKAPG